MTTIHPPKHPAPITGRSILTIALALALNVSGARAQVSGLAMNVAGATSEAAHPASGAAPASASRSREPIRPIPQSVRINEQKAALGKKLFNEPMLSRDGTVSCASCHELIKGGMDRRVHSIGLKGAEGTINAPTVFNCALNFKQFWDGRADSLEEQVEGPMQAPAEMGATWEQMLAKLQRSPDY